MKNKKPAPTPKPFARSAHFEALRLIRRKKPELYLGMSASVKAQLELYCLWRKRAQVAAYDARREKLLRLGGTCVCCGESDLRFLTFDHIISRTRGGSNLIENLQVMCGACNNFKGSDRTECTHATEARRLFWQHVFPAANIECRPGAA